MYTPVEASQVLAKAESHLRPAHDAELTKEVEACINEKCCHIIQPSDLSDGCLKQILVASDFNILSVMSASVFDHCIYFSVLSFYLIFGTILYLIFHDDSTKEEWTEQVETALKFPTSATMEQFISVEINFEGKYNY